MQFNFYPPILDKICKIRTNHLHLLSSGDDRKFVFLINSFFARADRPIKIHIDLCVLGARGPFLESPDN